MNRSITRARRAIAAPLLLAALGSLSTLGCRPPAMADTATIEATSPLPSDLAAAFMQAEREGRGRLGVGILHVESGERGSFHGGERFPMQSVFKLPLAIDVLARVDAGELRLDETVRVRPIDIRPGPPHALDEVLGPGGGALSLLDLLESSLISSDNSAADVLLERVGGPARVNARLAALGISGIDVSRSEAELMMEFCGVTTLPPRDTWTVEGIRSAILRANEANPGARSQALARYLADPRDSATPTGMVNLLLRVHQQDLLRKASAARLVAILGRVATGKDRLKALLPAGTVIAHKTGTSDETDGVTAATNDVGIITLPGNAGHVIVAAFLKESRGDSAARGRALALVGRAVFDHYNRDN